MKGLPLLKGILYLFYPPFVIRAESASDHLEEFLVVEGLVDVIYAPKFDRFHGALQGGVSGHDDDLHILVALPKLPENLQPRGPRDHQIQEDQVETSPFMLLYRLFVVCGELQGILFILEDPPQNVVDNWLIIDNMD